MSPIDTLPEECLEKILQLAVERPKHGLNVSLVCQKWSPIGLPLVYRDTYMDPNNVNGVLKALENGKEKGVGNWIKNVTCISTGFETGLGVKELSTLLALAPQVQNLCLARFWYQWLADTISISSTMSNVRILTLDFGYSPLPFPDPSRFLGQFSTWPCLEKLIIRMLSFLGDTMIPGDVDPMELDVSQDLTIIPHPYSKLKELVVVGNFIPPQAMIAGLRALRAPLETLHFSDIAMLGPQGVVASLQLVGKHLKTLKICNNVRRWGEIGSFEDVLFPRLEGLAPALQRLYMSRIDFPEHCFSMLPSTLQRLMIVGDTLLSAPQVWQGLEKQIERLNDLRTVEWRSKKDKKDGWREDEVDQFSAWGMSRSISIVARHLADKDV